MNVDAGDLRPLNGGWPSGRLSSLWDMLKIQGDVLIGALNNLVQVEKILPSSPEWLIGDKSRIEYALTILNNLIGQLSILSLPLSIKKANQARIALQNTAGYDPRISGSVINKHLEELRERIEHELQERYMFCLSSEDGRVLDSANTIFGDRIEDVFPGGAFDRDEATKCLSLGRYTACVFHLMRSMEAAVIRAGATLGVTIVDKHNRGLEWGKIISNMRGPIERMDVGKKKDDWSASLGMLYHVKQAWRNDTMHPADKYTKEEATAVFFATRSFLESLVSLIEPAS